MMRFLVAFVSLALFASLPAFASDGVIEINQAAALAGGITPSDTPGFPVRIDRPGSYALTGNLTVVAHSVAGIHVTSDDVNLDLRGFVITGPGHCTGFGSTLSCLPVGDGIGIWANFLRVGVRNGRVRGFGSLGVFVGRMAHISNLLVDENGNDGIRVGGDSIVSDSIVDRNRLIGIVGGRSSFVRNVATSNGGGGINAGGNSVVRDNVASQNAGDGIIVGRGSLVSDNSATQNGAAGISVLSTSSVQRNIVTDNVLFGLYLVPESGGTAAGYRENVISGGSFGAVAGGINMGDNSCNGTTTCP